MDFNSYQPYSPYEINGMDSQNINENNFFNPSVQYEQAYMYYRYLAQQMDYKIKCKEYEKLYKSGKEQ